MNLVLPCLVKMILCCRLMHSCPVLSCLALCCLALSCRVVSCRIPYYISTLAVDGTPPLLPVCRKFTDFSPEALVINFTVILSSSSSSSSCANDLNTTYTQQSCYRYLNKNKTYYLGDTEWLDNPRNQYSGFSVPGYLLDVFRNVLKPGDFVKCA